MAIPAKRSASFFFVTAFLLQPAGLRRTLFVAARFFARPCQYRTSQLGCGFGHPAAAARMHHAVDAIATQGLRVLGVARAACGDIEGVASPRDFIFSFIGLVGLADPLPAEVLLRFGPLHLDDLLLSAGAGLALLAILELLKQFWRTRLTA